ncbi:MAG: PadR family transcriptional regulator [Halioglobus sp.]
MSNPPKLSPTSYAMLGLLARNPQSAYELNTIMQTSLIRVYWPRAESHVYSEPKKLLLHNFVTEQKEQLSGRNRTVYTITDLGRQSLQDWLQEKGNSDLRLQSEFMLKLILADNGSAEDARATLAHSHKASTDDLKQAVAGIQQILDNPGYGVEGTPYNGIAINLMADMLIARRRWDSFALQALADISDGSSQADKINIGRAAYAQALKKLNAALDDHLIPS